MMPDDKKKSVPIPDTDDRVVAAMAIALHLTESNPLPLPPGSPDNEFLAKLERFIDIYEILIASVGKNFDSARAKLEELKDI